MKRALLLLCLCACRPPNADAEARALIDDLQALDDAATTTVHVSPNETGLGNAEGYVKAKQAALHERVLQVQMSQLSPSVSAALTAAYAKNVTSAHQVQDYVNNTVPKTDASARAHAKKLAAQICELTETPTYKTECDPFRTPNE